MKRVIVICLILGSILLAGSHLLTVLAGGTYTNSGQSLGSDSSYDVALADVDGDNDLDAVMANALVNRVWFNNGSGFFSFTGINLGTADSRGIASGNLDSDTLPDLFVANLDADNEVWLNQGGGTFAVTGQVFSPTAMSYDVALGYLDNNNTLDAFVVNDGGNEVWLNDGTALFNNIQSGLGNSVSREVILGDVNNDTFIDAYVANGTTSAQADELWLNDGLGRFTAVSQTLDTDWNEGAAFGDVDDDGDLDIVVVAWFGNNSIWLNQGGLQGGIVGEFVDSGQTLGSNSSLDVVLLDVDNDNDLDAIIARWAPDADEIWLNDGSGQFTLSSESLDTNATYEMAAGDLDGDNDADLLFANFGGNTVWLKGGFGLPMAWFDVDTRQNTAGQDVYPWAQPGNANLPVELSFAPPGAVDVIAQIETGAAITTQTLPFASGQQTGNLTVANPQPVLNETVTITLSVDVSRDLSLQDSGQVNPLHLMFVDASQGELFCSLCFADWLLKLLGFEPSFWQLHHMTLTELRDTPTWTYYQSGFASHAEEISMIMALNPALLWQTADTLESWTPAVQAYDEGLGSSVTVTQAMANQLVTVFEGVRDEASPPLADRIQSELDVLDPNSFVGLTMDEAMVQIGERIQGQIFLPLIVKP
jgi:hypothetical protein